MLSSFNPAIPRDLAVEANRRIVTQRSHLTGREIPFDPAKVIVSKTDTKGIITYANETFLDISGFTEEELIGAPHSILRHPDMPRTVFKFLWDNLFAGNEVFAYVLNRAKNGDHYWVFAHVTPTYDRSGKIIAFHSNRRAPQATAVAAIAPVYASLLEVERKSASPQAALENGTRALLDFVGGTGMSYAELIFSL